MGSKIKTLEEIAGIVTDLRDENKLRIVQCHGVFDIVHPGHIRHFEEAKKFGDILIVTVTPDKYVNKGPGRPVFNQRLRMDSLAKNVDIDYVVLNEYPTAAEAIKITKPDVYVKGKEYEEAGSDLTGEIVNEQKMVESVGGKIYFTDEITFSSTDILNRNFEVYPRKTHEFLERFREKYLAKDVIEQLKALSEMRVLVIGDAIIDQYCYCKSMNKSPKENIIPTRYVSEESFAGGSLGAANHIAGFCRRVDLIACLGLQGNSYLDFILSRLKKNVSPRFVFRDDAPTIVKRRFIEPAFVSKLFEVCYIEDCSLSEDIALQIEKMLTDDIESYDLVLATDFGHGLINRQMIATMCEKAKFLSINVQTNSANAGYNLVTKYPKADYVCIDEPEARLACRDKFSDLDHLIKQISESLNCNSIAVTHSKFGTITYDGKEIFDIPVFSSNVVDTMGAGDAFLAITSPLVASGAPMDMVGFVGNAVGALKVQTVGNRESVNPIPLFKFIVTLLK